MTMVLLSVLVFAMALGLFWAVVFAWHDFFSAHAAHQAARFSAIQAMNQRSSSSSVRYKRVLSLNDQVAKQLKKYAWFISLDRLLAQAGVQWRVDQCLMALACTAIGVMVLGLLFSLNIGIVSAIILGCVALPLAYLVWRRQRRRQRMDEQLPEALDLISQAMQAGHALSSAILLAANEGSDPIASEFRWVFDEINYGISTRQAMLSFAERIDSEYVRLLVTSVLIQIDTGGNMTEILKNTSYLIRDRRKFKSAARVLTAEARISAWILGALPFIIVGLLMTINPGFISVLWHDDLGLNLLMLSFGLMCVGSLWMWRLIHTPY